jgi:wyosine [tRNA(Phe)-imidazoG37] synthetase (radical SAM superfamily)
LQNFLTVSDHNRDVSHLRYIYPVVSRRAGGLSVGINLNINNACNWRCIYCQVPDLKRGSPPDIDLALLRNELEAFLSDVLHGDFMQQYVAESDRHLKDIAFSGNGEPTSAKEFPQVIEIINEVLHQFKLLGKIKIRLITNGSLIDKPGVLSALKHLAACNGEVWFKLDAGTKSGIARINDVSINPQSHIKRLIKCAQACPTFIQTCMFLLDGQPPSENEITAYIELVKQAANEVKGIHLYGLARPSMQAEASRLERIPTVQLETIANRIRQSGVDVYLSP